MTIKRLLLAALTGMVGACGPGPHVPTGQVGATIEAQITMPPFAVKARPYLVSDVNHYTFKLVKTSDSSVVRTGTSTNTSTQFTTVPDGTYTITAEAFSSADDSVSITQGGPQTASNTVTVAASGSGPFVIYSNAGTALAVTLNLLGGTGETIANQLTVNNGAAYSGTIGFTP